MKKYLSIISMAIAILFLSSCSAKVYSLQGNYDNQNKSIETTSSFDDVWNKVIDFFAINNIPISTLEKASGIISATQITIDDSSVAIEDKTGQIQNKNAWIAVPYDKDRIGGTVTCSFNVRVRQGENGKVYIGVNIGNIVCYPIVEFRDPLTFKKSPLQCRYTISGCASTGIFEKRLLELFK